MYSFSTTIADNDEGNPFPVQVTSPLVTVSLLFINVCDKKYTDRLSTCSVRSPCDDAYARLTEGSVDLDILSTMYVIKLYGFV